MNLTPAEAAAKLREAREAAERVLRLVPESPTDRDYDYCGNAIGNPYYKLENYECLEVRKVAAALLAQHPADEGEAIDMPFCESLGAEIAVGTYSKIAVLGLVHWHEDGTTILVDSAGNAMRWPVKITTRGQLRQLLAVLGIKQ